MLKDVSRWRETSGLQGIPSALTGTANFSRVRMGQGTSVALWLIKERHEIRLQGDLRVRGFYVLMRSGSFVALPEDVYIVSEDQLDLLRAEGIPFKFLDRSVTVRDIPAVAL